VPLQGRFDGQWGDDEAILSALCRWAERNGVPQAKDWDTPAAGRPTRTVVTKRFGSWEAALRAARLDFPRSEPKWSHDRIVAALREWTARHERLPTTSDRQIAGDDHPSRMQVWRRFGSWDAAISAAGITCPPRAGVSTDPQR
jgi:Homing endonuclease associated repeat